ncbi:MAG TPA: 23S rRNA (guanosine(2251)-2'-O)-methyltransferase RlmB [Vicinamibacterales bacterium]|nr:23S rRNA (guanosine(2251)-2'-O)-methyltransferase RlmB [Vicinamibacterales bacterium]
MIVYGINPVLEALRARKVRRLRISPRRDRRIDEVIALAATQDVAVERVDPQALDRAARGGVHQGVVADIEDARDYSIAELLLPRTPGTLGTIGTPLVVVLDGIEDPHNAGAILRTCNAAGATGVIRQARHSAALDGIVGKASAGALAHVRIATVVNIARAVEELKSARVWTIGLAGDAPDLYTDVDWTLPSAIVLGAEGTGLRRLVRERCDRLVRIPMRGAVDSLNVSVAAGVVLYEVVRQRSEKP